MPKLIPADPSFLGSATHLVVVERVIRASPKQLWSVLAEIDGWSNWYEEMSRSVATSTSTSGIGASRTVKVGALVADETFVIWKAEKAIGFTVARTNMPIAKRMLERVELIPTGEGDRRATRVRYTGAFQPHALTSMTFGFNKRLIRKSWTDGFAGLDRHVTGTGPTPRRHRAEH